MGIAMFTFTGLLAPLQGFANWLGRTTSVAARSSHSAPAVIHTAHARAERFNDRRIERRVERPRRPLRVVRVVEGCRQTAGAGRMRISGRMADVCAELDRLAALEAATH